MSIVQTKTIPLSELRHDPVIMAMPGQEARLRHLDDLLASIPVHGLLQSLKVRLSAPPSGPGQPVGGPTPGYLVTAGNRRLAALQQLWNSGGTIRGEKVTEAFPVPVIHSEESDDSAREQSVAENLQRVPPTPMAEALQYAEMAKHSSEKEIAAHFGVPPKRVAQRLKLATLHRDVQKALEDGKITLEAAQAFTVEPDTAKQAKYLKQAGGRSWDLAADRIRKEFEEQLVSSDSKLAKLIGKDAYLKAGGAVMSDPFGGADYWVSPAIIEKLVKAHWAPKIEAWKKKGWAFVASKEEYPNRHYRHRFETFSAGSRSTAEQMKGLGVVYWPDGSEETLFGVIDRARATPPKPPKSANGRSTEKPAASLANPGTTIAFVLSEALTLASRDKLKASPDLALKLLVAGLQAGASYYGHNSPIQIKGEAQGGKSISFKSAMAAAETADTKALLQQLAELVAPQLNLRTTAPAGGPDDKKLTADFIDAGAVKQRFDAGAYFGAVTKDVIKLAVKEMDGMNLADGKKSDMVELATRFAKQTGWLPPQLRTPSYAGPGKAKPAKLAKAA